MKFAVGPKDARIMIEWINNCLNVANGGGPGLGTMSIVMYDNFKAHMTSESRRAVSNIGCLLMQLPANTTSVNQVLDVGVSKPFKGFYEDKRDEWMLSVNVDSKVSREQCATWLAEAWENVASSTITNTARKIGFLYQN
jgi:predicted DNA-binding protein (MmcQ/YjbR family)